MAERKIGEALKAARIARGLSLRDLERASGMTSSHLSQVESGARKEPGFNTVAKIAGAIGVSLDSLVAASREGNRTVREEVEQLRLESLRLSRRAELVLALLDDGVRLPKKSAQKNTKKKSSVP